MLDLNIKAIVTVLRNGFVEHDKSQITDHLHIPADDYQVFEISQYFQQTYLFIDSVRKKTNVLVHCYAGISRSATIVIAYLLKKYNYSLDKVISMVKRRRSIINPNKGFIQQLKKQAIRMGIYTHQNQVLVEQALRKNSINTSCQKRRSNSNYMYKTSNQKSRKQMKFYNNISRQDKSKNNLIPDNFQHQNNRNTSNNIVNLSDTNASNLQNSNKIDKLQKQVQAENKGKINQTNQQIIQNNESKYIISEKMRKIEKLKSKILQTEKKRKQKQKRSNSQKHQKLSQLQNNSSKYNQPSSKILNLILNSKKNVETSKQKIQKQQNKQRKIQRHMQNSDFNPESEHIQRIKFKATSIAL